MTLSLLLLLAACTATPNPHDPGETAALESEPGETGATETDPAEVFLEDFAGAVCSWWLACMDPEALAAAGITDLEGCVADHLGVGTDADEEDCQFQADAAAECLAAVESWTCADVIDGGAVTPAACDEVCG